MKNFNAGKYISQGSYKSFQPEFINRERQVESMDLIQLLSNADREIGRLDMYSEYVPNIDLFISMHIIKEATQSSKIEGTKTKIEEAILDKENIDRERRDDWDEVQNYIEALNSAIKKLSELPVSSRLLKDTHRILLKGVWGKHKLPGEFRTSQNWIGGASIADAKFIPPVHTSISDYMNDLEQFIHNETLSFPHLLKIALIHYQFETIHPFLDGNGRIGRLLITLYLVDKGILKKPILYLSDFFERNRSLYYDNLTLVREKNDIEQWFRFFMVGVIETAKSSISTFDSVLKLQKEVEAKLHTLGSLNKHGQTIVNYLFQRPTIDARKARDVTGLSLPTVYRVLDALEKQGILYEMTGQKRGKQFVFHDYIQLFK
ncbi:MAG: Fic family protein [Bacteroidales bacterium]|nr:Fic family protein [Bacteroidales bacterium]